MKPKWKIKLASGSQSSPPVSLGRHCRELVSDYFPTETKTLEMGEVLERCFIQRTKNLHRKVHEQEEQWQGQELPVTGSRGEGPGVSLLFVGIVKSAFVMSAQRALQAEP